MLCGNTRCNVAFHVGSCGTRCLKQRLLLRLGDERPVDAGDSDDLGSAELRLQTRSPCRIGAIGRALMHHLAANEAGAWPQIVSERSGHAEADDAAAIASDRALDQSLKSCGVAAPGNGSRSGRSLSDACFRPQARCGEHIPARRRLEAHIPTATDLTLAAFKLAKRASAHSGKNFAYPW